LVIVFPITKLLWRVSKLHRNLQKLCARFSASFNAEKEQAAIALSLG
jgi:hypothetical protein